MEPTPEWIILIAPFASGAAGVGLTAGVAWGVMKQKYIDLERRVRKAEDRLESQVGEARCDKMRAVCQQSIAIGIHEIKTELVENRKFIFTEIARFMSQHKG
jgi:hypothetical protein